MKIDFTDVAGIIQTIRENKEFDGKNDIYEFMEHLDDLGETPISIQRIHDVVVFRIEGLGE